MLKKQSIKINKLINVLRALRDPISGCPWDKKQTLESIIPYSIEEVYEVAEEIQNKNYKGLKEELGDLLFQVVYLAQIAEEKNKFNFKDVVETVTNKMIYRHPHVFKKKKFKNDIELTKWWENSKNKKKNSLLDDIPSKLPAIQKTNTIQKRVSDVGFDYKNNIDALNKVIEEANELKLEIKKKNKQKINEELGDLVFATLDVVRKLKKDPELILAQSNKKFIKRWKRIEKFINEDKKIFEDININQFNKYWERSKF